MRCKGHTITTECGSTDWELVWAHALREEGTPIHLWQCTKCKRTVMATDSWKASDGRI